MGNNRKECKTCGKMKNLSEFYLRKAAPNRYQNDCKGCYKEKRKDRYLIERETENFKEKAENEELRELARQRSRLRYQEQKEIDDLM